jgi:hypothetical protein
MNTKESISDLSYSDYRHHIPGVACEILDCEQSSFFSSILYVLPVDYFTGINRDSSNTGNQLPSGAQPRFFKVICTSPSCIFGFTPLIKEKYYAYVFTPEPSSIEGMPAILIPKTFLRSSAQTKNAVNNISQDSVYKEELEATRMFKDNFIKLSMFG